MRMGRQDSLRILHRQRPASKQIEELHKRIGFTNKVAGQRLEARFTAATVEVFHAGKQVASDPRDHHAYRHTTVSAHMPNSRRAHLEWTPSRLIHWAEGIGSATAEVVPPSPPAVPWLPRRFRWRLREWRARACFPPHPRHGTDPASLPARRPGDKAWLSVPL